MRGKHTTETMESSSLVHPAVRRRSRPHYPNGWMAAITSAPNGDIREKRVHKLHRARRVAQRLASSGECQANKGPATRSTRAQFRERRRLKHRIYRKTDNPIHGGGEDKIVTVNSARSRYPVSENCLLEPVCLLVCVTLCMRVRV